MAAPLKGLERVPWDRLTHAYGPAGDVPARIRALTSPNAKVRLDAANGLANTIFHQGSRYRASAPAVPFHFELLRDPEQPDKHLIIQVVELLAAGYPEQHLRRGFDPAREFAKAERLARRIDLAKLRAAPPDEEDDWDPGRQALWAKDAYEAVQRRLATLQRLTRDAEQPVRMAAVRTLAWFPDAAAKSAKFVRRIARGDYAPEERANAIHALALLDRYQRDRSDVPWLRTQLSAEQPLVIRVTAAFALAVLLGRAAPAEAVTVLLEALQDPAGAQAAGAGVAWHWLGLLGQISEVIQSIRPKPSDAVIAGLCRAAETVQDSMAGVDVFYALLAVTFPKPRDIQFTRNEMGFKRLTPGTLSPVQLQALQAIGRSPVWRKEPFFYGRLMDLGLDYGLPWDPKPFAEYLKVLEDARGGP